MPSSGFCLEGVMVENKNKTVVACKFCGSKILLPNSASYIKQTKPIPLMTQKKNARIEDAEDLSDFWVVDDMYTFENIGFSLTRDEIKYLICADCEMGPVGYHDIETKKSYVALSRIEHKTPS